MLVFGVDVPLVEVVIALAMIGFILLVEIIIVVILLMRGLGKAKELSDLLNKLSNVLLDIKKEELKGIDRIKR